MPDTKTRREPIAIKIGTHSFVAAPLPWRKRNDLGEAIVQSYGKALQQSIFSTGSKDADGNEIIDFHFGEASIDYEAVIKLAYPDGPDMEAFDSLTFGQLVDEVLEAALVVNGLERQRYMLDLGKAALGPEPSGQTDDAGPRIESSPD